MGTFLRDHWIYIVAPVVIVVVLLGALAIFSRGGAGSPFIYNI